MKSYILAHDIGTSGDKAVLYSASGKLVASSVWEYPVFHPAPGFVEQDPADWWKAVCGATKDLLEQSGIGAGGIACVCFSGQMMGCLLLDKSGGVLRNMITWADTRAVEQAGNMERALGMENAYRVTGHRLSASYSAAKLLWVRENEPGVYKRAYKMVHAKDYIVYRLTGAFATDYSDAGSTNLFDLNKKNWSEPILSELKIPASLLPNLHASTDIVGEVCPEAASATGLLAGTPVVMGGGDGSCACVGAGVVEEGKVYNVIGSSSWISMAAREPLYDLEMRTFNWVHLDPNLYTPCGTMQSAGYSVKWARDALCQEESARARESGISPYDWVSGEAAKSSPGAGGLLYLPYLMGERSPRWDPEACGCFIGLTANSTKRDMLRAVLEGVGFNLKAIADVFEERAHIPEITVIGGGAKDPVWLGILSDIWGKRLIVPHELEEATSMGAAVCGGVGVGLFSDFGAVKDFLHFSHEVVPDPKNAEVYGRLFKAFNACYEALNEKGAFSGIRRALR